MNRYSRPVILAVDDDPSSIGHISAELERRYDRDYQVVFSTSAREAKAQLEAMREAGDRVALVLADQWMPELTGAELLGKVSELHPEAKRVLLIGWGDWGDEPTADAMREAMTLGRADYYALKPWKSPDELFHRTLSEFLHEWARADVSAPQEITVVADAWSPRAHEIRNLLARNGVPHVFHASGSPEGDDVLRRSEREGSTEPVVVLLDGRVLVDPSNAELARSYGATTELACVPASLGLSPGDFYGWQVWGGRGRYLRWISDDDTWQRLERDAVGALERRFTDGIRSVSTARLAVGTKPA